MQHNNISLKHCFETHFLCKTIAVLCDLNIALSRIAINCAATNRGIVGLLLQVGQVKADCLSQLCSLRLVPRQGARGCTWA